MHYSLVFTLSLINSWPLLMTISLAFFFEVKSVKSFETYDLQDQIADESLQVEQFESPQRTTNATTTYNADNHFDHHASTANVSTVTSEHDESDESEVDATNVTTTTTSTSTPPSSSSSDPLNRILPRIRFTCKNKSEAYYSDLDFCDIFHYCKSNSYRFTFLCPSGSYFNNQLLACEQNSTQLMSCNARSYDADISNSTETTATTTSKAAEIEMNTIMTATIESVPTMSNSVVISKLTNETVETNEITTTRVNQTKLTKDNKPSAMSTTTLIPPSQFIEPNVSATVSQDAYTLQMTPLFTLPFPSALSSTTSASLVVEPQQTPLSTKFSLVSVPQSSTEQSINLASSSTFFPSKPIKTEFQPILSDKQTLNTRLPNLEKIFNDLDMSNFDLGQDKSELLSMPKNNDFLRTNQLEQLFGSPSYEEVSHKSIPSKGETESKFSLSIHKFIKESLPSHYWKLFRGLNSLAKVNSDVNSVNLATGDGGLQYKEQSTFRKNDPHGSQFVTDNSNSNSVSMLSIPVLVPVNLSQDDYRQRMSASVLRPTVIPLKEKGKLIPAYVLQFSKSHLRYRRSALNSKRLLSLSLKPNLLYQVIPALLKATTTKHGTAAVSNGKHTKTTTKTPNYDILTMATQNMLPLYSSPSQVSNLYAIQLANLLKYSNTYELNDFNQFIPPYYFVDPLSYLQYLRPVTGHNHKRPPTRNKIPNIKDSTVTVKNQTASSPTSNTAISSGLLAVGSTLNGQLLPKSANLIPLPAPVGIYTNSMEHHSPLVYNSAHYSPLLYFGNSYIGKQLTPYVANPSVKKVNFHKNLKHKNAFNAKEVPNSQVRPNITMPANIYVPDDILEDTVDATVFSANNLTANKNDSSQMDHIISNDLVDGFKMDESSAVVVKARLNNSNGQFDQHKKSGRTPKEKDKHRRHEVTTKTNANYFNGIITKINHKDVGEGNTSSQEMSSNRYVQKQATTTVDSKHHNPVYVQQSNGKQSDSGHPLQNGKTKAIHGGDHLGLTSYLKHLKGSQKNAD